MAFLSRHRVYSRVEPTKEAKKIYVFCEGERREVEYFKYFQGFSSNINIIPIPPFESRSGPRALLENAEEYFNASQAAGAQFDLNPELGDEVWFVIDTDTWGEQGQITEIRAHCEKCNVETVKHRFVAQSNPAFEVWLYYHFFEVKPTLAEVQMVGSVKQFVDGNIKGGFDSRKAPVFIANAIMNSEKNFGERNENVDFFCTEVHLLAKAIYPFVEKVIVQILQNSH